MKAPILICVTFIFFIFVACGHNTDTREFKYEIAESGGNILTESEKDQAAEERLIERLQATIEMFDEVNKAIITINNPNDTEKTIDVLIVTKPNIQLTDEQKSGIINIMKDSVKGTVAVNIKEEQRTD